MTTLHLNHLCCLMMSSNCIKCSWPSVCSADWFHWCLTANNKAPLLLTTQCETSRRKPQYKWAIMCQFLDLIYCISFFFFQLITYYKYNSFKFSGSEWEAYWPSGCSWANELRTWRLLSDFFDEFLQRLQQQQPSWPPSVCFLLRSYRSSERQTLQIYDWWLGAECVHACVCACVCAVCAREVWVCVCV